jgi:hypothetical protein
MLGELVTNENETSGIRKKAAQALTKMGLKPGSDVLTSLK